MVNVTKIYTCPECSTEFDVKFDALTCCNETGEHYQCECGDLYDEEQDAIDCCTGTDYD